MQRDVRVKVGRALLILLIIIIAFTVLLLLLLVLVVVGFFRKQKRGVGTWRDDYSAGTARLAFCLEAKKSVNFW